MKHPVEVSKEQIKELARVCRLALSERELETFSADLTALEALAAPLLSVEVIPHVAPAAAIRLSDLRPDSSAASLAQAEVLGGAAVTEKSCFVVPPTWEDPV